MKGIKMVNKFLPLLLMVLFGGHSVRTEPRCDTSKFEVEYKLIEKFIQMEKEISQLKEMVSDQQRTINTLEYKSEVAGSSYTRWGRNECPGNGSSLLYKGYMAGSDKDHTGTGSNYLCLPEQPRWGHYEESSESLGKITGVEYQFWHHKADGAKKFLGDNMYNHNAPCAVCHTIRRLSMMIPGRNECYDGWTMEYSGYIVTGYYGDKSATEYVCLDKQPDKIPNGGADDDDNRLYFVEAVCGKSLTCPPYINGRELACVVCSL